MEHSFIVNAGGIEFRINSMNVNVPSLFQVYLAGANGKELRYHVKLSEGAFVFAMRADVPAELLALEPELSFAIKRHYALG